MADPNPGDPANLGLADSVQPVAESAEGTALDRLIHALANAKTLDGLPPVVDVLERPPPNPPESVQTSFVGASYVSAFSEAASFVRVADEWSGKHRGQGLAAAERVIDFGSGWGRISRILLAHVAPTALIALDVDLQMTALCNTTLPGINAMTVSPLPPTVLRDCVADAVFAFSVFSHLSPDAHEAWAREFGRLTTDGAMVYMTVLDRGFFDQMRVAQVAAGSGDGFAFSMTEAFPDVEAALAAYETGEPVYAGVGGGGIRTGDYYGWAAIPPEFIQRVWGDAGFQVVEWVPSGTLFPQAMVALVKRRTFAAPALKGRFLWPRRR